MLLFCRSVVSDPLWPHGAKHVRCPCPSPSPRACSDSSPLNWWCHPTISSSVFPFSSCLQPFPASGAFQRSQFFTSDCQSTGVSASAPVLPMNIWGWFPLGFTGLISLQSQGLSRVFSNTTVQKHQLFSTQFSLWSNPHIYIWLLGKTIALTRWTIFGKVMCLLLNTLSRFVIAFLLISKGDSGYSTNLFIHTIMIVLVLLLYVSVNITTFLLLFV